MMTGKPQVIYGNVRNTSLIENLPEGCCVEVPMIVDRNGLRPCHVGNLPPELAGYCAPHVFVQDLTVKAALEGSRDRVHRAAPTDDRLCMFDCARCPVLYCYSGCNHV